MQVVRYLTACTAVLILHVAVLGQQASPRELRPVREGHKWGYADQTGKLVIQPQFDEAEPFSEGLARVKAGGSYVRGSDVLGAPFVDGGRWGFINEEGVMVIKPRFYSAENFVNGRAYVSIGELRVIGRRGSAVKMRFYGKHGYIDKSGKFTKTSAKERFAHGSAG
jgi:hypothetical protein